MKKIQMLRTVLTLAVISAGLSFGLSSATAVPITIFGTGVDNSGNPLADGTLGDPHYTLFMAPTGTTTATLVRRDVGGYPIPPYLADDALSAWIGPATDSTLNGGIGYYGYRTSFSLADMDAKTASITGRWATDDYGVAVVLNGKPTGLTSLGFESWSEFTLSSGFVSGINTLDFIVYNVGGSTALRTELSGTVAPAISTTDVAVPDGGSTVTLLGMAMCGVVWMRRKVAGGPVMSLES